MLLSIVPSGCSRRERRSGSGGSRAAQDRLEIASSRRRSTGMAVFQRFLAFLAFLATRTAEYENLSSTTRRGWSDESDNLRTTSSHLYASPSSTASLIFLANNLHCTTLTLSLPFGLFFSSSLRFLTTSSMASSCEGSRNARVARASRESILAERKWGVRGTREGWREMRKAERSEDEREGGALGSGWGKEETERRFCG